MEFEQNLLKEYLKSLEKPDVENERNNTYQGNKYNIEPFEKWLKLRNKSLNNCDFEDIVLYLKTEKRKNKRKKKILEYIRSMFRWYREHAGIKSSRWYGEHESIKSRIWYYVNEDKRVDLIISSQIPDSIEDKTVEKQEELTLEDFKKLMSYEDVKYEDKVIMYLLAYFGVEISELVNGFTKENIYFIKGEVIIGKEIAAKKLTERKLYFDEYMGKLIKTYLKNPLEYERDVKKKNVNARLKHYRDIIGKNLSPRKFRELFKKGMIDSIGEEYKHPDNLYIVYQFSGIGGVKEERSDNELKEIWQKHHYLKDYHVDGLLK